VKRTGWIPGIAAALIFWPAFGQDVEVFTLYRNSVLDRTMRVHVATFDTDNGARYNKENCVVAADLFQSQAGVDTRYWCELGRFRD